MLNTVHTAASFGNSLRTWMREADDLAAAIYSRADDLMFESVTVGSIITGAPGQPVQLGDLLRSWQRRYLSRWETEHFSDLPYAWGIENAVGPYGPITLRALIGGFHSVKLSVAAWPRVVVHAARMERAARS